MSGKPLVLFGLGELSEVAAYYFENDGNRRIAAFTVDGERMQDTSFLGGPSSPSRKSSRPCRLTRTISLLPSATRASTA